MTDKELDRKFYDFVRTKVSELIERCPGHEPAVQVLTSWTTHRNETESVFFGCGNFYARTGMCREFLERDVANTARGVGSNDAGSDSEVPS